MENQQPTLAITDLVMLQSIVQVACERGAFRADEMSQIGQCYDRLSSWLASMTPPAEDPSKTEQPQGE